MNNSEEKSQVSKFNIIKLFPIIIIIIIILFIAIPSFILQYQTIQKYKENKYIDIYTSSKSVKNKNCTYDLSNIDESNDKLKCYNDTSNKLSGYYLIDDTTSKQFLYGLSKNIKPNLCLTLCTTNDFFELKNGGSNYSLKNGNSFDVVSLLDKRSSGMKITIEVSKDGEITNILSFISIGKYYNIGDTLKIVHKTKGSGDSDSLFVLTGIPGKSCSSNNNYNICVNDIRQPPDCINSKPLYKVNNIFYYPNKVYTAKINSDELKKCDFSKF